MAANFVFQPRVRFFLFLVFSRVWLRRTVDRSGHDRCARQMVGWKRKWASSVSHNSRSSSKPHSTTMASPLTTFPSHLDPAEEVRIAQHYRSLATDWITWPHLWRHHLADDISCNFESGLCAWESVPEVLHQDGLLTSTSLWQREAGNELLGDFSSMDNGWRFAKMLTNFYVG